MSIRAVEVDGEGMTARMRRYECLFPGTCKVRCTCGRRERGRWRLGRASMARLGDCPCGQGHDLAGTCRTTPWSHAGSWTFGKSNQRRPRVCARESRDEGGAGRVKHGRSLGSFRVAIGEDEKENRSSLTRVTLARTRNLAEEHNDTMDGPRKSGDDADTFTAQKNETHETRDRETSSREGTV